MNDDHAYDTGFYDALLDDHFESLEGQVPFPDSLTIETPTPLAAEILTLLDGVDVSAQLQWWLDALRYQYTNAVDQGPLF